MHVPRAPLRSLSAHRRRGRPGALAAPPRHRINLGSGNEPLTGWINVDRRLIPGVNVAADVTKLPFQPGAVGHIIASSVLEHFLDPYEVLDQVHMLLCPDGTLDVRVPSLWSQSGLLDRTHHFLADSKLWREMLDGYFEDVHAKGEGVRYRDSKLLVVLCHAAVKGLRMREMAQAWRFTCRTPRWQPHRAYIPWWLEERYGPDPSIAGR